MSTVAQPLKYLWTAYFDDGKVIEQPADDRYSKHDDDAEYNPSAFRDLLDYQKKAKLIYFDINDGTFAYGVDLPSGRFGINGTWFEVGEDEHALKDRELIYYRAVKQDHTLHPNGEITAHEPEIEAYFFGYKGKNANGKIVKKVVRIT